MRNNDHPRRQMRLGDSVDFANEVDRRLVALMRQTDVIPQYHQPTYQHHEHIRLRRHES